MFDTLLIANRGEIARRIIRTCRIMGIRTVAIFSDADGSAAHAAEADVAVGIGGAAPADSYLRTDAIIDAASRTRADAIHPGYGFLSENAHFARAVADAGLVFVGPTPEVIAAMGSKVEAKRLMAAAGVPLLPSAELADLDPAGVTEATRKIGYPLLVKASAGGGGRGMRLVRAPADLAEAVAGASREAESAFGDGTVFAEQYVSPSRHVEVQILGDGSGRVIHLHERECSIQRRHQKIIEEAPSPSLTAENRSALHATAVRAGEAIGYSNAGTVEFLLAPDGDFFFLEVNTRLQVEHPVTEAVLGVDLVRMQLEIAAGEPLPDQADIGPTAGHAIEARLYAEDPVEGFLPSTGRVHRFEVPGPVRVDAALGSTGQVSQHYDPMVAKVVSHARTRAEAARRLGASLRHARIAGIRSNAALLVRTLTHPEFLGGDGDTGFLERHDPAHLGRPLVAEEDRGPYMLAAALGLQAEQRQAVSITPGVASGFRNVVSRGQRLAVATDEAVHDIEYLFRRGALSTASVDGADIGALTLWQDKPTEVDLSVDGIRARYDITRMGRHVWVTGPDGTVALVLEPRFTEPEDRVDTGSLVASMPGTVVAVAVAIGDTVEAGVTLLVVEAMKMELSITAPSAGKVAQLNVAVGDTIETGTVLAVIDQ